MAWDQTKAQLEKLIGKTAKVPGKPATIQKAVDEAEKSAAEFQKSCDAMEATILAYQNAFSGIQNAVKQFSDKLAGDDLGLDKSAGAYKTVRPHCQKIIDTYIKSYTAEIEKMKKGADELDKHMNNLSGYKSPKMPSP